MAAPARIDLVRLSVSVRKDILDQPVNKVPSQEI